MLITDKYYKHDFWSGENLRYVEPHFRLSKVARIVNNVSAGRECDLLDVGCGPAALMRLLHKHIRYYGIDIALHSSAPNLRQADFVEEPLVFDDRQFDIIVAQGIFEYIGRLQAEKFREIREVLRPAGRAVMSYVNFDHLHRYVYPPYNNVQPFRTFYQSLASVFQIERIIPTSYRWSHAEPSERYMKAIQMHVNWDIPIVGRLFAVEYLFICSHRMKH